MNYVSLPRRLAAICYDALLLMSVFFIATFMILPLFSDRAIESGNLAYNLYLLIIAYLYFSWQWLNGGQTLGMKSWRIQLVNNDNSKVSFKQVSLRYVAALLSWSVLGLGFLWALFDKEKSTWHDRLSSTRLILRESV